jgi:hypothetical protein
VPDPTEISRRAFVLGTTATVAMSAAGASSGGAGSPGGAGDTAHLVDLSAVDAVAHMSQGSISAEKYAQALLSRCQSAHAPECIHHLDAASARRCQSPRSRAPAV